MTARVEQGQLCWWIVLAVVIAVVVFIRIHFFAIRLERDEGKYAYSGQPVADPSQRSPFGEASFNKEMVFVSESLSAVITLFHPKSCLWSRKTAIAPFPAHCAIICLLRIMAGKRSGEALVAEVVAAPSRRLDTCEILVVTHHITWPEKRDKAPAEFGQTPRARGPICSNKIQHPFLDSWLLTKTEEN
jgi:hypothetical protein